jgi:hypothetical protein
MARPAAWREIREGGHREHARNPAVSVADAGENDETDPGRVPRPGWQ